MNKSKKLIKKVVSFCEEVKALVTKIEDAKDLVDEVKDALEDEEKSSNFSGKLKTKLRKLNRLFSEEAIKDDLDEVKDDLDELIEDENFSDNKSLKGIKRSFKRFSDDITEMQGEISKASAAAASEVTSPDAPAPITGSVGAPDVSKSTGEVDVKEPITDGGPDAVASTGKIDEPEPINFSQMKKTHLKRMFSSFEDICDNCEDITEDIETFTKDMVEEATDKTEISSDKLDEKIEDKPQDFCEAEEENKEMKEDVKKLADKIESVASDVRDVITSEGFGVSEKENMCKLFSNFCNMLDGIADGTCDMDSAAEALESIEFACKDLSKKVKKFSSKKAFCGIMKAFDELPEMVDAISIEETPVEETVVTEAPVADATPAETEDFCDDIDKQNEAIDAKIDDIEKLEKKISDEKVVAFSKIMRKTLKTMKCFSDEDVEAKAEQVGALADKLEEVIADEKKAVDAVGEVKTEEFSDEAKDEEKTEETKDETAEEVKDEDKAEETKEDEVKTEEESTEEEFSDDAEKDSEEESEDADDDSEEEETEDEEVAETEETEVKENEGEVENFSEVGDSDEAETNSDVVNEIIDENPTDFDTDVEVEDDSDITNFSNSKKTEKNSGYGMWLTRQSFRY